MVEIVVEGGVKSGEVGAEEVLFGDDGIGYLPVDVEVGVVKTDAAFGSFVVEVGALVGEDGVVFEGGEAVGKPGGQEELHEVVGGEQHAVVLAVGRTALANVDGEVEGCALDDAHQLGLGVGRALEVETAHDTLLGARLVVLHEGFGDAGLLPGLLVIALEEVAAGILEHFGMQDEQAVDRCFLYFHT